MLAAPAAGILFGLAGEDALVGSIVGSSSGMVVGAGVGATLGYLLSAEQEWPWAGGVIGAGVGLTIGGVGLALARWSADDNPGVPMPDISLSLSVPIR